MNISIKATNTTLTPAIRSFVEEKLGHIAKFFKEEYKIRVELEVDKRDKDGKHYRAEVDIQPNGYFADAKANDFYEAMDLVLPKIKEQLAKNKDKSISKRRRAARKAKGQT